MLKKIGIWLLDLFLFHTDKQEKEILQFFTEISRENLSNKQTTTFEYFLQKSPIRLYLLLEKKYKGYKFSTHKRRLAYDNFDKITLDFKNFQQIFNKNLRNSFKDIKINQINSQIKTNNEEKLFFIFCISQYFHNSESRDKIFKYRETSSFIRLLKDPTKNKLVGDCNQILSLYSALYAQKFEIKDLKIKIFKEHVCLHFEGIDIETTNGEFYFYKNFMFLSPLVENIAISILDKTDNEIKTKKISPLTFLAASKIALKLSSHKTLVQENIKKARYNLSLSLLKQNKFNQALKWSKNSPTLTKNIYQHWGYFLLKQNKLKKSREIFRKYNDIDGLQSCDNNELNKILTKISGKNIKQITKQTLKKAIKLSNKLDDSKLTKKLKEILKNKNN